MRDLEIRGAGNLLGAGAVGPHRRGRLRPLLPDGHRGGRRAEGRAGRRAASRSPSTCPSTPTCPREYVRARRRAHGGVPPARRGHRRRPTSTTSAPSGRTATARRRASAVALLDVARLRVECVRLGIRSITVQRGTARIAGLALKESQKVRLRRLAPKAVAKDDELVVPVVGARRPTWRPTLVALLRRAAPAGRRTRRRDARASLRSAMKRRLAARSSSPSSPCSASWSSSVAAVASRRRRQRARATR